MNILRFTTVNALREHIFRSGLEQYVLLQLDDKKIDISPADIRRMQETASEIASRLLDEGIDVKSEEVRAAATGYGRVAVDYV